MKKTQEERDAEDRQRSEDVKNAKITSDLYQQSGYENMTFVARDAEGKEIFGHSVSVSRAQNFGDDNWTPWKINWGSIGATNAEEAKLHLRLIDEAINWMELKS